jgi:hypothetical protein
MREVFLKATDHNDVSIKLHTVIDSTDKAVVAATYDVADVLVRLHASRSTRLPNVQFVHWGDFHWPRIRTANGGEQLLSAQKWCERARPDDTLYDHLANAEHELFGRDEHETVVFRKTTLLWDPMQPDAPVDDLMFYMEHAVAYIYDGDVHPNPKTAPYGREIISFSRTRVPVLPE